MTVSLDVGDRLVLGTSRTLYLKMPKGLFGKEHSNDGAETSQI